MCGQIFDWEVFHFSHIVGSFDLLRMWLLVLDVIAARVIPVTRNGMFLLLVIATMQSSEGENKHMCIPFGARPNKRMCVPFGAYRMSRLVPCLDLASPATLPMGASGLQPCTETLFRYHKSQLLPESTFQGMSNSLWLWVGTRSWLAKFLMVQGLQITCNNGRYEFLTTSIAEGFITWTSKSSLTSWRWQLDWAVFQCSCDVTTRMWLSTSI